MRSKFTLPIALCALLGTAAAAPVAADPVHYTSAAAIQVPPLRTVQIAIDRTFTLHERATILRTVNECDATAGAPQAHAWTVARIDSRNPMVSTAAMKRALALTFGTTTATVFVVADRIGSRDLAGIMMHESGPALGAGHNSGSALMNPYYTGDKQACIDKGAVVAVSASQHLALDGLNWCDACTR